MSDDVPFGSTDEPFLFRFIESGMHVIYEYEPIGGIQTTLGHTIQFCPVLAARGWSDHKEFIASLRLKHFADKDREIGRCLVNQDEIAAWSKLLLRMQEHRECSGLKSELKINYYEYTTRHGVKMVWPMAQNYGDSPYLLYVASKQPAILPSDFLGKLLQIFDDFESFVNRRM
jgi:hypothetical protein